MATPRITLGFSTLELIAVLAVILVIMLLAWPSIQARRKVMLGEELDKAMIKGDRDAAIKLLKRGAPPDTWYGGPPPDTWYGDPTPHYCIYCRTLRNVDREMFQVVATPENVRSDAFRFHCPSLLAMAVEQRDKESVNVLLKLGVSATQRYQCRIDKFSPRYARLSPLAAAIEMDDAVLVNLLLSYASPAELQNPGHPNGPLANDSTLIHSAVRSGNPEWVKLLVERGVPVDAIERLGETALHEAARLGSREMVDVLLANGADPGSKDVSGARPLDKVPARFYDELAALLGEPPQPSNRD